MVLPVRSVTAENCTVLPTTTEGMLGEIVTVVACSVLDATSRKVKEISTVSNLRIFGPSLWKKPPIRYARAVPRGVLGVPKVALALRLPLDVSK
jgi:hypothetical protein